MKNSDAITFLALYLTLTSTVFVMTNNLVYVLVFVGLISIMFPYSTYKVFKFLLSLGKSQKKGGK